MGREIIPDGIQDGDEFIPLSALIPMNEAQRYLGLSTTLMYREMGRRDDLNSYKIGGERGIRLFLRDAVESLKRELDGQREPANVTI